MWKRLAAFFHPFHAIASELRILRELYELELSERTPPLVRITKRPHASDTTVSYAGDEERPKSALDKAKEAFEESAANDDFESGI